MSYVLSETQGRCAIFLPADATMDDKLDTLYDHLPIMRGEMRAVASELGVHSQTVSRWLKRLADEGLAKKVSNGWLKCYDWAEKG
jgi:Mn-dependent DtxR family transcriptional regulator